jgi:AcrR family transcriptional regulator
MGHPGWEQIARTAARLFLEKGFASVSLREIAEPLGIKPASLYHHCAGGKAELYVRSVQESMRAYRSGLEHASEGFPFEKALARVAEEMVVKGGFDLSRIALVDLPAVREAGGDADAALDSLHAGAHEPLRNLFLRGQAEGVVRSDVDPDLAAASVMAIVSGLGWHHEGGAALVRSAVQLLLDGARP